MTFVSCVAIVSVAWCTNTSWRRDQISEPYRQRTNRWFAARILQAKTEAVDRVRGAGFRRALDEMDTQAIFKILAARDPDFMPKKEISHQHHGQAPASVSVSSTSIAFGHFTDDELETLDRLLKKAGVPEHLLNPAPAPADVVDVEAGK